MRGIALSLWRKTYTIYEGISPPQYARYINMNDDITDMNSARAYKFRLYPDSKRHRIDECPILSQKLYNAILERAKKAYEKNRKSKVNKSAFNRYTEEAIMENKGFLKIYSQSRQDIFIRVQKAGMCQ